MNQFIFCFILPSTLRYRAFQGCGITPSFLRCATEPQAALTIPLGVKQKKEVVEKIREISQTLPTTSLPFLHILNVLRFFFKRKFDT